MDIGKEGEVGSRVRNGKSKVGRRNLEGGGCWKGRGLRRGEMGVWRRRDYGESRDGGLEKRGLWRE